MALEELKMFNKINVLNPVRVTLNGPLEELNIFNEKNLRPNVLNLHECYLYLLVMFFFTVMVFFTVIPQKVCIHQEYKRDYENSSSEIYSIRFVIQRHTLCTIWSLKSLLLIRLYQPM